MIKVSELRIGNWIHESECEPYYFQVEEIRKYVGFEDWVFYRKGSIKTKVVYPIPLTEDILLKCGFEVVHKANKHYVINDPNGFKDLYKISIFPTMNEQWHIAFSDILAGYKVYIPTTKIKYLHQLQNLFFALCGEELTINL